MTWEEVCEDPSLQDLPYKIELNRFGQVVMSPASNEHGRRQSRIAGYLLNMAEGEVISECSIETKEGTKVADVSLCSSDFFSKYGSKTPFPHAPEICVEIFSPSNSRDELELKRALYFQQGAKEVWFCENSGEIRFFAPEGEIPQSVMVPEFPKAI